MRIHLAKFWSAIGGRSKSGFEASNRSGSIGIDPNYKGKFEIVFEGHRNFGNDIFRRIVAIQYLTAPF